jgi:hypothetical protein
LQLIIAIHIGLFLAAWGYARLLNRELVHRWYSPDRVYLTVIGGDVLIGLALGALWGIGVVALEVLGYYTTLHIAAGAPIIYWQRRRAAKRHRDLEDIERRP